MLDFLVGKVVKVYTNSIAFLVQGVAYRLQIANAFAWTPLINQEITVYVELIVRQDALVLYGFQSEAMKSLFLTLNKVTGIGPKSAMAIIALDDHEGLIRAIEEADVNYLVRFPGVGKKTAQQMILDLKGNIEYFGRTANEEDDKHSATSQHEEILSALAGLGYSQREIAMVKKAIQTKVFSNNQEGLSYAFKLLIKE